MDGDLAAGRGDANAVFVLEPEAGGIDWVHLEHVVPVFIIGVGVFMLLILGAIGRAALAVETAAVFEKDEGDVLGHDLGLLQGAAEVVD